MTDTDLVYLREMQRLELDATITQVAEQEGRSVVMLDRTIFYPQGGGQPSDRGTIESESGMLQVEAVRWNDGVVAHIGTLTGSLAEGDRVRLSVSRDDRELHTRLHSAGHLVDMAIDRIGLGWIPGKGFHFPQGPYVEYAGELQGEKAGIIEQIETAARSILEEQPVTTVHFVDAGDLARYCRFVPDYIPGGKPIRVVTYGDFGVACGGTHVARLDEIGSLTIRKIKAKGDAIRVSYDIAER